MDFDRISGSYAEGAIGQRSAAEVLLNLVQDFDVRNILDLGCGPGHVSREFSRASRVVGIDPSRGMVEEARTGSDPSASFLVGRAEALPLRQCFDLVFCNSAFQWFDDPEAAVEEMFRVLRPGGWAAVQSPAGEEYSPTFLDAVRSARRDPGLRETFKEFESPWFFPENGGTFASLFEGAGFDVEVSRIERFVSRYSPDKVFQVFRSGAVAGYLNPDHYREGFDGAYRRAFLKRVREAFREMAEEDGFMDLVFNRAVLLAQRPEI